MRANSPNAFFASIVLHGLVAVAIALVTILMARHEPTPPVIFELVSGEPVPGAERGPSDASVEFNLPKAAPRPVPQPQREVVKTAPVPKPVEKKVEPKKVPKEEKKTPASTPPPKMSYEEFVKQHGKPQPQTPTQAPRPTKTVRIDTGKITGEIRSGERGQASSRAEMDALDLYLATLRDRLREAHDETKPPGLGDTVSAEVSFVLAANGEISNVRIVRSSGYPEFDQSVIEAFRRITWPGPRPDRRTETMRLTFRMREQ